MTAAGPSEELSTIAPGRPAPRRPRAGAARVLRVVAAVALAAGLALAALVPRGERTLLIGRQGDASAIDGFSLPSDHLGAHGRWTRGDGAIRLPRYPAPAAVRLHVAAPDVRVPDAIEVVVNGVHVARHTLAAGWNDVDVPVDPRFGTGQTIALQIRSAVTRVPGAPPQGIFVERATLTTGGLATLRRTPVTTLLALTLAFLAVLTAARAFAAGREETLETGTARAFAADRVEANRTGAGIAPVSRTDTLAWTAASADAATLQLPRTGLALGRVAVVSVVALAAWVAVVGFRVELLGHARVATALAFVAAGCIALAAQARAGAVVEAWTTRRLALVFTAAGALLIVLLFPEAVFKGQVLSQADMFYEYFPWRTHMPADYRAPDRAPLGDIPMMVYPFTVFAQSRWWAGVFPLWTNAMNAGQPFLGTFQSALFSPFTLVAALLPLPQATVVIAALRLIVGGTGLFLFLRALGLSRWAATFGGITYLLNPYMLVWLEHPPAGVPPWLPWMLLAAERLAAPSPGGLWRGIALLALTTALVLTGAHPHTALFVAMLGGAYAVIRAATVTGARVRTSVAAIAALVLGGALVTVQVLPFVEYLSLSYGAQWRNQFPLNPFIAPTSTLITAIVPNFLGHHSWGNYAGPTNYLEHTIYPGLATWLLAAVGLVAGVRQWRVWFFALAALVAMLVFYGAPGMHQLVSSIPLIKAASLTRVAIIAIAALTIVAAYGVDAILGEAEQRVAPRAAWTSSIALLLTTCAIVVLAALTLRARTPFLDTNGLLAFTTRWTGFAIGLACTVCVVSLARTWGMARRSAAGMMLAIIAAGDLLLFGRGFRPLTPRDQVFPVTPEIQIVQQDAGLFRVLGLGGALTPNAAMIYGFQDVRGYDGLTVARYAQLLEAVFKYDHQVFSAVGLTSPLIDLLNVKYVFGVPNVAAPEGWFEKLTEGDAPLYRNTRVFPRAFLVDGYTVLDGNPARRTLRDGRVDFHRVALLEQDPPADARPVQAASLEAVGSATITQYTDHRVTIQTDATDRRLLVLTDVHYPGWTATIDGQPTPIHRANFAFRAVSIPAGQHTIVFGYHPTSFRVGAGVSFVALVILGGLVMHGRRLSRRKVSGALAFSILSVMQASPASAQQYTRISVAADGTPANGHSAHAALSANGRYVAFVSAATNLVTGDTNASNDVFVKDRQTGAVTRVSVASDGSQRDGDSGRGFTDYVDISADGTVVVFVSRAPLAADDTNTCPAGEELGPSCSDIYVHDLTTHVTTRVSVATDGGQANGPSRTPAISDDGRYVVFASDASSLVTGDTNGASDVFLHDRVTHATTRVSVSSTGAQGELGSSAPAISANGAVIGFVSDAKTLTTAADPNACSPVTFVSCARAFLHTRATSETTRIDLADWSLDYPRMGGALNLALDAAGTRAVVMVNDLFQPFSPARVVLFDRTAPRSVQYYAFGSVAALSDNGRVIGVGTGAFRGISGGLYLTDTVTTDIERGPSAGDFGLTFLRPSLSPNGRFVVLSTIEQLAGDTDAAMDVFVLDRDADGDGIATQWEEQFGLSPTDASDAAGDPDGDGQTNLQEYQAGTHPKGLFKRYLAEGAANAFFSTDLMIANPGTTPTTAVVRLLGANGRTQSVLRPVGAQTQADVRLRRGGLGPDESFASVIESDQLVVVGRTMRWTARDELFYGQSHPEPLEYGASAEAASTEPSTTWYLAEGATHGGFDLFYLLQNATDASAHVTVRYLRPSPAPAIVKQYEVGAHSRRTIWVDAEGADLDATDVSAAITSDQPILVERAMYYSTAAQPFVGGHAGAGVTAPALRWFLAEGATGPFFDLFVLVANTGTQDAALTVTYLRPDAAPFTRNYTVARESRLTISVDGEDARLDNTPVSVIVESTNGQPVIVERAMWWPQGQWYEGHLASGTTTTGTRWAFADGIVRASTFVPLPNSAETYVLIANTSDVEGSAKLTLLPNPRGFPPTKEITVTLPPRSRVNVPVSQAFAFVAQLDFGMLIESDVEIVVERATYWSADGLAWTAGTASVATKLP